MTEPADETGNLPIPLAEPPAHRRRRLLVLREVQRDRASWETPELFDDTETWIVDYDQVLGAPGVPRTLAALLRRNLLRPDQLYLLSPYDDAYVPAYEAETAFALRKCEIFTLLCFLLGATKVEVTRTDVDESTRTTSGGIKGNRSGAGVAAELERNVRERLAQQLRITTTSKGGAADVDAADSLLHEHGLDQDSTMRGLLDLFRHGSNKVKSQSVRLNVTSEASRELKAALTLKIPATLSVAATLQELESEVQELIVEMTVNF